MAAERKAVTKKREDDRVRKAIEDERAERELAFIQDEERRKMESDEVFIIKKAKVDEKMALRYL